MVNALPDKGERLRSAIKEIETRLIEPASPMDCENITSQFNQLTVSSSEIDRPPVTVYLEKPSSETRRPLLTANFTDERLNQVKERLKARQAQRDRQINISTAKLISLDDAVRLNSEEKKRAEVSDALSS